MKPILAIATLALTVAASTATADVYRRVDADGRVQYSDRWVPGSELIKTTTARAPTAPSPSAPDSGAARPASPSPAASPNSLAAATQRIDEQLAAEARERAVQQDLAKVRAEQCKKAKDAYEKTLQARRVFREDKDGTKTFLTEPEMAENRVKARSEMDIACAPVAR